MIDLAFLPLTLAFDLIDATASFFEATREIAFTAMTIEPTAWMRELSA